MLLLLAYQLMVFGRLGPRGHRVVVPVVLGSKSAPVTVWALFIMEATVWGIGTKLKPATLTLVQVMISNAVLTFYLVIPMGKDLDSRYCFELQCRGYSLFLPFP